MKCFTHQKERQSHSSRVLVYPSRPESISCWISFTFHYFWSFVILSIFQSSTWQDHNSVAGSGEILRGYLTPPKAPPRSAAIRREVYLALHIFTAPYLDTDWTPQMLTHCAEEQLGCFFFFSRNPSFGFWISNTFRRAIWAHIHWFHLIASDWFNWHCVFNIICRKIAFWLFFYTQYQTQDPTWNYYCICSKTILFNFGKVTVFLLYY